MISSLPLSLRYPRGCAVYPVASQLTVFTLQAARLCHGLIRILPRMLTLAGLPIYVARFPGGSIGSPLH